MGAHHGNGRVELPDAHPARRVLAVEALVRDEAAVRKLHRGLRRVRIQVDELLACVRGQKSADGARPGVPFQTRCTETHPAGCVRPGEPVGRRRGGNQPTGEAGTGQEGTQTTRGNGTPGSSRRPEDAQPAPSSSASGPPEHPAHPPLTDVADEVMGAVGLASDHAQGLGHHEAVLRDTGEAGRLSMLCGSTSHTTASLCVRGAAPFPASPRPEGGTREGEPEDVVPQSLATKESAVASGEAPWGQWACGRGTRAQGGGMDRARWPVHRAERRGWGAGEAVPRGWVLAETGGRGSRGAAASGEAVRTAGSGASGPQGASMATTAGL